MLPFNLNKTINLILSSNILLIVPIDSGGENATTRGANEKTAWGGLARGKEIKTSLKIASYKPVYLYHLYIMEEAVFSTICQQCFCRNKASKTECV